MESTVDNIAVDLLIFLVNHNLHSSLNIMAIVMAKIALTFAVKNDPKYFCRLCTHDKFILFMIYHCTLSYVSIFIYILCIFYNATVY